MKFLRLALTVGAVSALLACSPKESTPSAGSATPSPVLAEASAPVAAAPVNEAGKKIYGATCSMCHAAGVGGAPKPGDKADWAPRLAQGMEVLYKHAQEGFTGAKGMMPARGGSPSLKDEDIKAAVDFMADQSR